MSMAANLDRRSPEFIAHAMGVSYEVPNQVVEKIPEPLVSVRTVTFRHAAYLRQCIEGVLMQRTTFPFEYVIGEDFSDDDTRAIAFEYASKYPDRIRLVTADENVGMRANGHRIREACRGKYHAICEGDDYWTDPLKLQKQVDLLEAHPGTVLCFHNAWVEYDAQWRDRPRHLYIQVPLPTVHTTVDLLRQHFIPTASIMYRRAALVSERPLWARQASSGDIALLLLLSLQGEFRYIDEPMSVYRKHDGGVSNVHRGYDKVRNMIHLYESFNHHTGKRFDAEIGEAIRYEVQRHLPEMQELERLRAQVARTPAPDRWDRLYLGLRRRVGALKRAVLGRSGDR